MFFWIIKLITVIPLTILFPCIVKGKKNIPKGKVIFVCNHLSNIDYVYLFNNIWRKQYVLAKKELFKNKFVAWFFKKCCGIEIDRENISINSLKQCMSVLKNNKVLTIFPEGTRNKKNFELLEFKDGATMFATRTNAPIVPIIITKRPRFLGLNKVVFGEPIYFDSSYKTPEGLKEANQILRNKMIELQNKHKKKK